MQVRKVSGGFLFWKIIVSRKEGACPCGALNLREPISQVPQPAGATFFASPSAGKLENRSSCIIHSFVLLYTKLFRQKEVMEWRIKGLVTKSGTAARPRPFNRQKKFVAGTGMVST
jgi:hypothetical protein